MYCKKGLHCSGSAGHRKCKSTAPKGGICGEAHGHCDKGLACVGSKDFPGNYASIRKKEDHPSMSVQDRGISRYLIKYNFSRTLNTKQKKKTEETTRQREPRHMERENESATTPRRTITATARRANRNIFSMHRPLQVPATRKAQCKKSEGELERQPKNWKIIRDKKTGSNKRHLRYT